MPSPLTLSPQKQPGTNGINAATARVVLDWVIRGAIGLLVWLALQLHSDLKLFADNQHALELRITAMEHDRFTAQDGKELDRRVTALEIFVKQLIRK